MERVVMILSMVLIFSLIIGATIYLPLRLGSLFGLGSRKLILVLFILGTVSVFASMGISSRFANPLSDIYGFASTFWMGFFLFLFIVTIVHHIISQFISMPSTLSGVGIIVVTLLISGFAVLNSYSFKVVNIEIPVNNLKQDTKIAVLSDIHLGSHRKAGYLEKIIARTNELTPDIVLIPGDLVDGNTAVNRPLLSRLSQLKAPSYFVSGNHDGYVDLEKLLVILEETGVTVLKNDVVQINGIQLVGLAYMNADEKAMDMHPSPDKKTIKETMPTLPISSDIPTVLTHHSPVGLEYVSGADIDVMISGHTHAGGQIFPITLLGGVIFDYPAGLYEVGPTRLYVSAGLGTFGPPMRLGSSNELTLIRLTDS